MVCFIEKEELSELGTELDIDERIIKSCFTSRSCKLESFEGFDFFSLSKPDFQDLDGEREQLCIYFRDRLLAFIYEGTPPLLLKELMEQVGTKELNEEEQERVLYRFFDRFTAGDVEVLERLESEISDLEEALITSQKREYIKEIIGLRKRVLAIKRYYDQLQDMTELIEENENGLIAKKQLRYFRMLTLRVGRLAGEAESLRDYISQVREAYQAQVDIDQNSIMKLFTVITAVFMPLTLIAGWYGMNLEMPEYHWKYGYPAVILLSAAVVIACLLFFKKRRWF